MTAEEMAPFLDAPAPRTPRDGDDSPYYPDEGFVLPALLKFGGEASVDEKGHLLYTFASLQRSGVEVGGGKGIAFYLSDSNGVVGETARIVAGEITIIVFEQICQKLT